MRPTKVWLGPRNYLSPGDLADFRSHQPIAGIEITDKLSEAELLIVKDAKPLILLQVLFGGAKKKVLFISEPRVVWPVPYIPFVRRLFDLKILRGRMPVSEETKPDFISTDFHSWVRFPEGRVILPKRERVDRIALVNAHKFSFVKGQLYSLRRECGEQIDKLDLYGKDWTLPPSRRFSSALKAFVLAVATMQPLSVRQKPMMLRGVPSSYKGALEDKRGTLATYKLCLVIENSQEILTEKIWDAWFSGCIPIFVGPDLRAWGVPDNLYVRAEPDISSVQRAIEHARDHINHGEFINVLESWLNSRTCRDQWTYEFLVEKLYSDIRSKANI